MEMTEKTAGWSKYEQGTDYGVLITVTLLLDNSVK